MILQDDSTQIAAPEAPGPCPFCGAVAPTVKPIELGGECYVWCGRCLASGPSVDVREEGGILLAVQLWNRRFSLVSPLPSVS